MRTKVNKHCPFELQVEFVFISTVTVPPPHRVCAECYQVEPVVAVVPLINQILSLLTNRHLILRLSHHLQIQVRNPWATACWGS